MSSYPQPKDSQVFSRYKPARSRRNFWEQNSSHRFYRAQQHAFGNRPFVRKIILTTRRVQTRTFRRYFSASGFGTESDTLEFLRGATSLKLHQVPLSKEIRPTQYTIRSRPGASGQTLPACEHIRVLLLLCPRQHDLPLWCRRP